MLLRVLLSLHLCLMISLIYAQESTFYLFSNLTEDIDSDLHQIFKEDTNAKTKKKTILSLGDNQIRNLELLKSVDDELKVKFLTGDHDQKKLDDFKKLKNKKGYKYLTDGKYCPYPKIIDVDDNNIIISINSNWFLDRSNKFRAKNSNCKIFNEVDFFEELESIIDKNEDKNIVLLSHHNTISNTQHGGKQLWPYDLIPLAGNLYASYRRNIGRQQDLTSENYKYFATQMNRICSSPNVFLIAGHDHVNSVYRIEDLTAINVNSGNQSFSISEGLENSIYQSVLPSYIKLSYSKNQTLIEIVNTAGVTVIPFIANKDEPNLNLEPLQSINTLTSVPASQKYAGGRIKNWLMGSGYRKAWSTPVSAAPLDLNEYKLTPYSRGGGLQTQSVKLKSSDKRKYAFRLLDKEPEKSLNEILQKSVYKKVVQELITTMHPYGPLVAHELIKETDIIHIKPELYIMSPNQSKMQEYSGFENKLGTLEEKPKGKSKKREGFSGADEVVSTFQMLREITNSPKNKIDKMAFAKARVFDMYIGDWDRHEDNWKWAKFENKEGCTYQPIPKDRDHVFSKWTGVVPKFADYFIANAENFGSTFGNLRQLNFKAYYLDRQLATELSEEDWQKATDYIIEKMSDEIIDQSILAFPTEIRQLYSEEIKTKLKARKLDLKRAVYIHYCHLAHQVNVTGSNKKDIFDIVRNPDGTVTVDIYRRGKSGKRKNKFYHRTFTPDVTSTIYCYGLDGKDEFNLSGQVLESIKIRIIGGSDEDNISDQSSVKGGSKITQVYDSANEDIIVSTEGETKIKRPSRDAFYDPYAEGQNSLLPLPSVRKSSGNGWGIDLGLQYIIQGYNKPGFAKHYKMNVLYYPQIGAYRIDGSFRYRYLIGKSDFITSLRVSDEYDKFPFFYGIGSETTFDNEAREEGLYRLDYDYCRYDMGLSKSFYTKSEFTNTFFVEFHGIDAEDNSGLIDQELPRNTTFYGYKSSLQLDYTDRTRYPTDGNKFNTVIETRISSNNKITANFTSDISYYKSVDFGVVTTFAAKWGYQASFGDTNFYHLSSIGSNVDLSGYTRNRFLDKYATYYNTEIRFDLGTIQSPIIQFNIGTFLLYDGGKVWNDKLTFGMNDWKTSYGIGFFVAPYSTDYAFSYSLIRSEDFNVYSQFQLGFKF